MLIPFFFLNVAYDNTNVVKSLSQGYGKNYTIRMGVQAFDKYGCPGSSSAFIQVTPYT